VGTRTDAALAQVLAARADFAEQVDRLEAAGRAAVDIPAKVRRSPAKAAAVAGGAVFLAVGGPRRVFRKARKAITGHEDAPLPKALLPKDIEKSLKKMGTDGDKVRGTIERDFAKYLDDREAERRREGFKAAVLALTTAAVRPVAIRAGKRVAEQIANPDSAAFEEQLRKIRERTSAATAGKGGKSGKAEPGAGPGSGVGI
jgi:hypothetical protein